MSKIFLRVVVLGCMVGILASGVGRTRSAWGEEPPPPGDKSAKEQTPPQPAPESKPPESKPEEKGKPETPPPTQQPPAPPPAPKETPKPSPEPPAAKPPAEKPPEKPAEKPPTITITPKPFKIEVSLDGYFEAREAQEILLKPEAWMDWEVVSAVKHGAQVRQGEVLIQFESKKLNEAITEAKEELRAAEIGLQLAQLEVQWAENVLPMDLALVERTQKRHSEDFDRFFKVQLPLIQKAAELRLRLAQFYLDMEKEELRQLEKMYQADDLTEETEEFILKRQRFSVELANFEYEEAQKAHEEFTQFTFPRREEDLKTEDQVQRLRTERAKATLPLLVQKAKTELEKAQLARRKVQEKLDQLQADLALMTLKAPMDGVVYYGRLSGGRLTGTDGEPLRKGDKVQPGRAVMTILKLRPLTLVAEVPEDKFYAVRSGMQARVEPKGFPDLKLSAVVAEVDRVPIADGKFRARLTPVVEKEADALVPGMACKVKLVPYQKTDAIVVPKSAIEEDPLDDQKAYVYLVVEGKEPQRHPIVRGRQQEKEWEITGGLKPGDKILATPPKKDKEE